LSQDFEVVNKSLPTLQGWNKLLRGKSRLVIITSIQLLKQMRFVYKIFFSLLDTSGGQISNNRCRLGSSAQND
jgi:hypothetical protein